MKIRKEGNIDEYVKISFVKDPCGQCEVDWSDDSSNESVASAHQEDDVPLRGGDDKTCTKIVVTGLMRIHNYASKVIYIMCLLLMNEANTVRGFLKEDLIVKTT